MIGKLFEIIEGGKIIPNKDCFIIKPIAKFIEVFGEEAVPYLHYMISLNPNDNPFSDVPEQQKSEQIQRYLRIDIPNSEDDMVVESALECIRDLYSTPIYRSVRSLKKLLDRVNEDIETLSDTQLDYETGGNAAGIVNIVKHMAMLKKELKAAQKDYMDELGDVKGKGSSEFGYDEFDDDDLGLD
jgi:hypothetical protein